MAKDPPASRVSREGIICPYCGCLHIESEDLSPFTTYWGETSDEFDCADCDRTFMVSEDVSREWIATPL